MSVSPLNPSKLMSADRAVAMIRSGQTLGVGGAGGVQEPDLLLEALARRFTQTGEPAGLTEFHPIRTGEIDGRGTSLFGARGLLKRIIGGSFWPVGVPELIRMIHANEVEAFNYSIGIMYALLEAAAAGRPGVVSRIGIDTCVDPRQGGGALNAVSEGKGLVSDIFIDGERFLFYRAVPIDVAFIRATSADEDGNLGMEEEPAICGPLLLAQAARVNGGKVIAQVKRVVPRGSIPPHMVRVPGILVDAIVENPSQRQITHVDYDPTLVGAAPFDLTKVPPLAEGARKAVLRRALLEAAPGEVLAIGFGLPGYLPAIAIEAGIFDEVTFTIEHGVVGGVNGYAAGGRTFPVAHAPQAILDAADQLRLYSGGGIDRAYLGMGEFDPDGNVNVSLFGDRIPGAGGFVEITQGIRRICFCCALGEQPQRKLVDKVQQVTFSGRRASESGQEILYVTELGVMRLTPSGLQLSEIAPGLSLDAVNAALGRRIAAAPDLREMPAACFAGETNEYAHMWRNRP